jgi:hypothetical protein
MPPVVATAGNHTRCRGSQQIADVWKKIAREGKQGDVTVARFASASGEG